MTLLLLYSALAAQPGELPVLSPPDLHTRACENRFRHGAPVVGLAFSPDGKFLASASRDNTVRVWDRATATQRHYWRHNWVSVIAYSSDGKTIVSGADDGSLRTWKSNGGTFPRPIHVHAGRVTAVLVSTDGRRRTSTGLDGTMQVWETSTDNRIDTNVARHAVTLAATIDDSLLAAGGIDVKIFKSGALLHTLPAEKKVLCLAFRGDGKLLAAGGEDSKIRLIDPVRGADDKTLSGHVNKVTFVGFTPNGKTLVSASLDRTVRVWNLSDGKVERTIKLASMPTTVALSSDGILIAVPGPYNRIDLFETATGKPVSVVANRLAPVTSLAVAVDGKRIFSGCADGTLRVLDPEKGKQLGQVGEEAQGDVFTARSDDGKLLALGAGGKPVRVLDATTLKELRTLPNPAGSVSNSVAFSPDARFLAVRYHNPETGEGVVRLWQTGDGSEKRSIGEKGIGACMIAFSPDGTTLALALEKQGVSLWSADNGKPIRRLTTPCLGGALAFSPDGRFLAVPCEDGVVAIHAAATGEVVRYLAGHTGTVHGLAFSADGRMLASGGGDAVVRLWEVASGSQVYEFWGHYGAVTSVAFLPGGRRLVSGGTDANVSVWDLSGEKRNAGKPPPTETQVVSLWKKLAEGAPVEAHDAIWQLALAPDRSVPFIREQLRSLMGVDAARIEDLIHQLDHNKFAMRERASEELGRIIHLAGPALRRALAQNPSPELSRRGRELLDKLKNPLSPEIERLRSLRALEILEKAGTTEARKLLEEVAGKVSDAELKVEARLAVSRLAKREPK